MKIMVVENYISPQKFLLAVTTNKEYNGNRTGANGIMRVHNGINFFYLKLLAIY